MRKGEGINQQELNFKLGRNKRGRPQKHKGNNVSGGRNWKSKFLKSIKKDQGLKSIISIMSTEDR